MTVEIPSDSLRSSSSELPSETSTEKPQSPRDVHGVKCALVVLALLSSLFLYALDNTVVANVQPKVVETFYTRRSFLNMKD
ncbi:hypothetical protein BDV29DRAFT_154863 [Aspergillus leporis]|uniref:Major facilitator superfamily (MFS) profile domain-containing protein n=1 Tax=Aspergillus leporis TaxID=41062 RepID=A0A5N5X6E0_9EURO|nr:hypothetical protein BDV29DRAFT_154863 [Aspergillus leporis]